MPLISKVVHHSEFKDAGTLGHEGRGPVGALTTFENTGKNWDSNAADLL